MKKVLSGLPLLVFGLWAFSQSLTNETLSGNADLKTASFNINESRDYESLANVSAKAERSFKKSFKNASDEKWYAVADGYRVKFVDDGEQSKIIYSVAYDKKGNWLGTIRSYDGKELDKGIKYWVKTRYLDYSVTWVEEVVLQQAEPVYFIHLKSQTKWIELKISGDDMEELLTGNM
jgi:hypothetical protein